MPVSVCVHGREVRYIKERPPRFFKHTNLLLASRGRMTMVCRALASGFLWKRLKSIDYLQGDEFGDDWLDALPSICAHKSPLEEIIWQNADSHPSRRCRRTNLQGSIDSPLLGVRLVPKLGPAALSRIRVFSVGLVETIVGSQLQPIFAKLDRGALEELYLDDYKISWIPSIFPAPSARAGGPSCPPWTKLRKIRLFATGPFGDTLNAVAASCPILEEAVFSWYYYPSTPDAREILPAVQNFTRILKPTLKLLDVPITVAKLSLQFLEHQKDVDSWRLLPGDVASTFGIDFSKVFFDGLSIWGRLVWDSASRWLSRPFTELFAACHPQLTADALFDMSCIALRGFESTEESVEFFITELQKWRSFFSRIELLERPMTDGWQHFCNVAGSLYHIAGSMWQSEMRAILDICPSVIDVITVPANFRKLWSPSVLTMLIMDTAWWKATKCDFNMSQTWGRHPLHNLVRSGAAILEAVKSPLLDWNEYTDVTHWFCSLLQRRHLCEYEPKRFDEALTYAYNKLVKTGIRPVRQPLTELQLAALSQLDRLEISLPFLAAHWKVLLCCIHKTSPKAFLAILQRLDERRSHLPPDREAIEAAATEFWRQIVVAKPVQYLGARPTAAELSRHVIDLMQCFPVLPALVFEFARALPRLQTAMLWRDALVSALKSRGIATSSTHAIWLLPL